MQTGLRGRDFISDMDFSKEEIETVIDVALKLKRDRALGRAPRHPARQGAGHALLLHQHPHPLQLRGGHGPVGRPRRLHRQHHHPDQPRRHGQGDRRDLRSLLRRHRHPPVRLGLWQQVHQRGGRGQPRARPQHAVRCLPPLPDSGRSDDHHREGGRPPGQDHQRQLGLCQQLPEAHLRAPEPDLADDPLRHERAPDPSRQSTS